MYKLSEAEQNVVKKLIVESSSVLDKIEQIDDDTFLKKDAYLDSLSFINVAIGIEEKLKISLKSDESLFTQDVKYVDLIKKLNILRQM